MLREKGRKIVIDECAEICGECPSLERAKDRRKDAREFDEELLVVTCDLCPPRVYVCAQGEGDKIVELRVQRWIGRGGLKKGRNGVGR